jgi:hypothetical protein
MAFFLLANVAGLVRPMGLKPLRFTGFPFIISAWGFGIEEFFDWSALALNAAVAIGLSGAVALGCAWARSRCRAVPGQGSSP